MAKQKHRHAAPPLEVVDEPQPAGKRTWWIAGVTALVGLAVGLPLAVALLNPADDRRPAAAPVFEPPPPPKATPAATAPPHASTGKELFAETCGGCHTLAAAGTRGAGPDLDKLRPGRRRVLAAIERGGSGYGVMPPKLLEGSDARRVARFVATATRR